MSTRSVTSVAAWLRAAYPDQPGWHVCQETIYQALYHGGKGGLSRQLTRRLRTGRPLRKRRRRAHERRSRFISPALLNDRSPLLVERRQRVGDWEGDLIVGRNNQSASPPWSIAPAATCGCCTWPGTRTAEAVRDALLAMLAPLPDAIRLTLTWDQGSALACHHQRAPLLRDGVFFAHWCTRLAGRTI